MRSRSVVILALCNTIGLFGAVGSDTAGLSASADRPPADVAAGPPEAVRNVRFWVEDQKVHIDYDLSGPARTYHVTVHVTGGPLRQYVPRHVEGDIGGKVRPGPNRKIVWDAVRDLGRLEGEDFVFEVAAAKNGHGRALWMAGSSIATIGAASAVLYVNREKRGTIVLDIPDPPK
jgi:hypothetical protein